MEILWLIKFDAITAPSIYPLYVFEVSVPVKKEKATATKKEKKFVEIDGKKYYEDTKEFCDALNIAWDKRKQAIKKALIDTNVV